MLTSDGAKSVHVVVYLPLSRQFSKQALLNYKKPSRANPNPCHQGYVATK